MVPGMIAAVLKQKGVISFDSNDQAYGSLVSALLPVGIKGVVIVGFLCAIITSLAAHFNSSATLFTIDFYKNWRPNASEHKLVGVGRAATVVVIVLGLLWIPIMMSLGSVLYEYLQNVQSLIAPAIAAVFLMGICSKKITPKAGQWGLIIGFCIGMLRLFFLVVKPDFMHWFQDINWLWFSVYLMAFTMVLMIVISFFTEKASEEQLQGLTFSTQSKGQKAEIKASWSKWDIVTTLGVVALCAAFYWYFW
jgi:SSS family solute:Na+ symporter